MIFLLAEWGRSPLLVARPSKKSLLKATSQDHRDMRRTGRWRIQEIDTGLWALIAFPHYKGEEHDLCRLCAGKR